MGKLLAIGELGGRMQGLDALADLARECIDEATIEQIRAAVLPDEAWLTSRQCQALLQIGRTKFRELAAQWEMERRGIRVRTVGGEPRYLKRDVVTLGMRVWRGR